MDAHIKEIQEKLRSANAKVKKYQLALEALQDICKHKWNYDGHGHNDDHYTCSKCGTDKWE